MPDTTRVGVLVSRARAAGAMGATRFADWLIIDEEWFGPCADMDALTYLGWRRRALDMYAGPHDAYVAARVRSPRPRARPAPPSGSAVTAVRSVMVLLALLLVVALAGVSRAARDFPPGGNHSPADRATETCTGAYRNGLYRTACGPM